MTAKRQVAVIGAGGSGLTAGYVLQRAADLTLYEAGSRLGGHAHTQDPPDGGRTLAGDSGFIVHNERPYPHLLRLFREIGVAPAVDFAFLDRGYLLEREPIPHALPAGDDGAP